MHKRKIGKSVIVLLLLCGIIFSSIFTFAAEKTISDSNTDLTLWYDEPATKTNSNDTWQEATLPIGNGILGANVYGELSKEHLTLNEETLWSGGRNSVSNYNGGNPTTSKVAVYESYAKQLLEGKTVSNIENLSGESDSSSGYYNGYQPLGDLYIAFDNAPSSTPSDYKRTLNLNSGISNVAYSFNNISYERNYFVSNPDNVIVSHLKTTGSGNLNFTVSMTSKQTATVTSSVDSQNRGWITCAGTVTNNGLLHNTQILIVADTGSVTTVNNGKIKVANANEVTIYVSAATDYKNTFYDENKKVEYYYRTGETAEQVSERVNETVSAAASKGYEKVLADHTADYQNLYDRVSLELGQKNTKTTDELLKAYKNSTASKEEQRYLEVLLYQYGRYLLIAGSRENSQLPTTLQGIWNDNASAPWYSDIHTNINEEMNYWLSNNCNLTECALPLVNYMSDLEIPGGRTVETYTGSIHGIMAHTQNTPYGYTSPGWSISTWGWSPAAATWLLQNCYDYYEYSGDTETLRNTIYPMLKEQVLMYEDLLKEYNGRKVMPITQSPELATISAGNTYEQSLIWQLYADTIEAATVLEVDADSINNWKTTMDQLKPIEIGTSGQVKEWYNETTINSVNDTSSHRHLSNLLGLYPGNLFDTKEKMNAAIVSLNNKNFGRVGTSGNDPDGGWTYGQLINSWARVGDGANAYFSVSQLIKNRLYNNLWDYHTYNTYGAFQIDGNYGYSAGVGEMLLQSNLGYINPIPALPDEWSDGSVTGLLAEGGFEVNMNWSEKQLISMQITSKNGGSCSVKSTYENGIIVLDADGNKVDCTVEDDIYTFDTVKGAAYSVISSTADNAPDTSEITNLKAVRGTDGSVTLTWDAKDGVTYTITRKKIDN